MASESIAGAPADFVVGGRVRVRAIRAWWRTVHPPPSLGKRLEPAYFVGITVAVIGPFAYGTASSALGDVATPDAVATWGPSLALVALLALVRWGAVQGPVVFSVPDVAQLLGAPLRRADLVIQRLVRGLIWGAGGALIVAALALVGIAGDGRDIPVARGAGFIGGCVALGVLGVAGASLVQGSARWDRITRLGSWPVFAIAVGLVFVSSSGDSARQVVLWSGPWGWVVQPIVGKNGQWVVALALLVVMTVAAVALAAARRGQCSTERHMRRAEARGGAVASLYSLNTRYVGRSLAGVNKSPAQARSIRLPTPRSPRLAVAWRDATAALATRQRLGEAVVLAGGGALVCVLNADHPAAVVAGSLAIYLGASRLLEPLRSETDTPSRTRVLLRAPLAHVLSEHTIVPGVVVALAAITAAAGAAVAGALPTHGAEVVLLTIAATPSIMLCAALNSRRGGQLSNSVMSFASADVSGMSGIFVIAWWVAWPVLAIAFGAVPVSIVGHSGDRSLASLVAVLVVAPPILVRALRWEKFAPE